MHYLTNSQIFGFEQVESPELEFDVIWLKLAPSFYIHLIERDPSTKLPEGPWSATLAVADPKNLPRGHHICFSVSNFDYFVRTLKVYIVSLCIYCHNYLCICMHNLQFYVFLMIIVIKRWNMWPFCLLWIEILVQVCILNVARNSELGTFLTIIFY